MLDNEFQKFLEQTQKENYKTLGRLFNSRIKQSFLIDMLKRVVNQMGDKLYKYYDTSFNNNQVIMGDTTAVSYDICRMIVGVHKSNSIFISEEQRIKNEKSEEYKLALVNKVVVHIKLRNYASELFRKTSLMKGEEYLYYPVLYRTFALTICALDYLNSNFQSNNLLFDMYMKIIVKTIAALTLIEDNLLDNAYPICRTIIELYFKTMIIELCPNVLEEQNLFLNYDLNTSCCGEKYSKEFNEKYNKRKNTKKRSKIEYLHYGWVDSIDDYHNIVKCNPYCINGVISYIENKIPINKKAYGLLRDYYKMCSSYTHGNASFSKYPVLHYFELSTILGIIIPNIFKIICKHLKHDLQINDVNVLELYSEDFITMINQYNMRTTENFEAYYSASKK